ncbi:MAG: hypothetical protein WCZ18_01100 [Ottowia sp.]|nr:hypothetical protein [Ottowia sp.]
MLKMVDETPQTVALKAGPARHPHARQTLLGTAGAEGATAFSTPVLRRLFWLRSGAGHIT